MDNDELLDFAGYLGLKGEDQDLFYESYYGLDNEQYEIEREYDDYYQWAVSIPICSDWHFREWKTWLSHSEVQSFD